MKKSLIACGLLIAIALLAQATCGASANAFDHEYRLLADVLKDHVRGPRVDYAALKADRASLDGAAAQFDSPATRGEAGWTPAQRKAFWINAYNAFTLRAIVDHYPIKSGWFTLSPRNSIRQIDGVWTDLKHQAAGRTVTLDDIEHRILRPTYKDARIHFAVNCASISCPPLAAEPYRATTLDAQLDAAGTRFLTSPEGLKVEDDALRVSSIFKWYGEDFVEQYAPLVPGTRDSHERGILGAIVKHGPSAAADLARSGRPAVRYLSYDWSLNDVQR
jgi:hypothetical protein